MANKLSTFENDFITIWAHYLLTNRISGHRDALKTLAKLGQPDAIQAWYKFNDQGTCPEIDKKAQELAVTPQNTEELAAISSYEYCDQSQRDKFRALMKRMRTTITDYQEICQITKEQFDEEVLRIKCEMRTIPFIKYHEEATNMALKDAQATNDVYVRERATELLLEHRNFCLTPVQRKKVDEKIARDNKSVFTDLYYAIQEKFAKNRYWTSLDDPKLAFTFAKSVKMFNSPSNPSKIDNLATKILGTLSQRELSSELYDAMEEENSTF